MSRPNPAFLGVFLIAAVAIFVGASLMKGGFFIGRHEGDTLHLLQMVFREARGEWPHLDFQTPIGVLATAPIAFFVWLGAGVGHAILYAQALVAVVALPAIWWVAASRFPGRLAYLFGLYVVILILALVFGGANPAISISMHYNRWAWAAAFVAIAAAVLPADEELRSPVLDGLVIGAALSAMALIKMTYFAAFLLPIAVALIGHRAWRSLLVAITTGLAIALTLTALAGPMYWLAYLRDLFTVMGSEVRTKPGHTFVEVVNAPEYFAGSIVLLVSVILLRQAGRKLEGLVLLLLVPGFFYVTYQNWGNDPIWIGLLGLLLFVWRPLRPTRGGIGFETRQPIFIAGILALAFAAPSAINLIYSPFRHLATDVETYAPLLPGTGVHEDLQAPRIRTYRVDAKVALDGEGEPFAAYFDPEFREDVTEFRGELLPSCQIDLGTVAWFEAISNDLKASGITEGKTVFLADILSSFWLFGAYEPLPGASPWYYGGLPGWDAADFLLVPLCPFNTKVRKIILDEVTETGGMLTEVRRNEYYVLYAK